jgi:hypothetical protein
MEDDQKNLMHVVYVSKSANTNERADLLKILDVARTNNKQLNLTGMLLHVDGAFFQVLEGYEADVTTVYTSIMKDSRHSNITKIIEEAIPNRMFNDWTMGFADLSEDDLEKIEGLNDFFGGNKCLRDIDSGRSKKLLQAFSNGRWRLN